MVAFAVDGKLRNLSDGKFYKQKKEDRNGGRQYSFWHIVRFADRMYTYIRLHKSQKNIYAVGELKIQISVNDVPLQHKSAKYHQVRI